MNRSKALSFLPVLSLVALSLASCSGPQNRRVTGGGGGSATVSLTLAAVPFVPPPGTSILSFALSLSSVQLTPTSGSVVNIPLNTATYVVDLTRLQSDSAFLGQLLAKVPAGTYNKVTVGVASAVVTYCTDLGGTSGCDAASVKQVTQGATTPATSSFSATLTSGQKTAIQIQFNFANAITISTTQAQVVSKVDLTATNVLTASILAPTSSSSSLGSGQLDFVEDITGMVTAESSTSVTVQTSQHGSITAAANQSSISFTNCVTTPGTACPPKVGQFASIDTVLNSDGTFTLLDFDPIAPTSSDWIEGIVSTTPSSSTQFQIVTNDIILASSNSLIGANLLLGDPVQVTLSSVPPVQPFVVDSKGLFVVSTPFTSGSTDATNIIPGQTVALHVTKFTAKIGTTTPAAVNVDTVVLRFTRVAGSISNVPGPTFNIQSLPPFFGSTVSYQVQLSTGTPPTNYDGVSNASGLIVGKTAAMRALYFGPTFQPAFSAAKVRQF
jgi:Domain of unknown function (DUF4382)